MTGKDISKFYANEHVVRIIAGQVVIVAALALYAHSAFLAFLLTADFALRAFTFAPSPLTGVARLINDIAKLKPKPIFAAPKKFAALLGFTFSAVVFLLLVFKAFFAAYIVGSILIICAVLESVFCICIGCYFYDWMVAPIINKRNNKTRIEDNKEA